MSALPEPLDPNDPINILLRPFDAIPQKAAAPALDPNAQALADAQASQAARDAEEAERQRKLAEEKANLLRQQTVGGKNNATIFGGAEGEVVYESNVRPSGRQWQSVNRVETKRTVVDFNMAEPLPPSQLVPENAPSALSPPKAKPVARPVPVAEGAPSVFSPTAGVHPTTSNKTEEFMKKVGGNTKVRQCPSFRMLEFQIQYDEYKQTKSAVS